MLLVFKWKEGREERQSEIEIPAESDWEQVKNFVLEAVKKAYKYSSEELPKDATHKDL